MEKQLAPAAITVGELEQERANIIAQEMAAVETAHRCRGAVILLDSLIAKGMERFRSELDEKAKEMNAQEIAKADQEPVVES